MSLVGWACHCHSGGVVVRSVVRGVDVASWCPARFAVGPTPPPPKVRDATAIRARPPLVRAVPLPAGIAPPPDIPRLIPRLLKLGLTPNPTYAVGWWSVAESIEAPAELPPPDADRTEDDTRDAAGEEPEYIALPTGEVVRKRAGERTTRDVPVIAESVALRVPGLGVQCWRRIGAPELKRGVPTGRMRPWEPDAGWLLRDGRITPLPGGGVTEFKKRIKELESR
jgi:hypothetical protein